MAPTATRPGMPRPAARLRNKPHGVPFLRSPQFHWLKNFSDTEQYLGQRAASVALEVFGKDFTRPGKFYTAAGRDEDIPYVVVCRGDGRVVSYNLLTEQDSAARGVMTGVVITKAEAMQLRDIQL